MEASVAGRQPEKLGSIKDWAASQEPPLDPSSSQTLRLYTGALGKYNQERAAWLGISKAELKSLPNREAAETLEIAARSRDHREWKDGLAVSLQGDN